MPDPVNAQSTVGYDSSIVQVQHVDVIVETHEDAMRWIDWMVSKWGFAVDGPYPWDKGTLRLLFVATRDTVADTRNGDWVWWDGQYEVKGE